MNNDFHKKIISKFSFGYACCKIILDEEGIPVDYEFVEINAAYAEILGLEIDQILHHPITEVIPNIKNKTFDWINYYGQIALTGKEDEFEQYSKVLNRRYKVQVFSPEKYFIVTIFTEMLSSTENTNNQEDKHYDLLYNVNEAVVVLDGKGNVKAFNRPSLDLLGYSKAEFRKINVASIVYYKDKKKSSEYVKKLKAEGFYKNYEGRVQVLKDRIIWIQVNATAIYDEDGVFIGSRNILRDITETKQAEEIAQETSLRLEQLAKQTRTVTWEIDAQGLLTTASDFSKSVYGYAPEELEGKKYFYDLHPAEGIEEFKSEMLRILSSKEPFRNFENKIQTKDGRIIWVSSSGVPLLNDKGDLLGYWGTDVDITENKWIEESIWASGLRAQRQRVAIASMVVDETIVMGDYSSAMRKLTQVMSATLQVQRASVWLFNDDGTELHCTTLYEGKEKTHSAGEILLRTDFPSYFYFMQTEIRIYADDAQTDPRTNEFTEVYLKPLGITSMLDAGIVVDGKLKGAICLEHVGEKRKWHPDEEAFASTVASIISQILINTERKKAETELQKSEQRFRDVVEAMGEAVYEIDMFSVFTYLSFKNEDIFNQKIEVLLGQSPAEFIHQEDLEKINSALERSFRTQKPFRDIEVRALRTAPAATVWIRINGLPMLDENGKLRGFRGTVKDITEQKQIQNEVIKRETAEAENRSKSEFLANMSHEIRTPLNSVIGFTDLLKNTPLAKVQGDYVQYINTSAHSLLGIINDILDFSKIEAGKLELEEIKTDLIELVEQAADIIKFQTTAKNLELLLNIPLDLPRFVVVDSMRIKQILVNLLSNAVKFTEKGEIELKIEFTPAKNTEDMGIFAFSVRDTGIGISAEQQKKLFKAFSQADSSTTRKFGGTGLGLIISNSLSEKMGNSIQLESEVGVGSTFSFVIRKKYEYGERLDHSGITNIKRVLVIDDNYNNRLILQHILEYWNIRCVSCSSGKEALETIKKEENFDVIIVDYNMPDLDGLDTIRLLREDSSSFNQKKPAILLHSSSDVDQKKCTELDIFHKLAKPVKQDALFYCLNAIHNPIKSESHPLKMTEALEATLPSAAVFTILVAEDVPVNMILIGIVIKRLLPGAEMLKATNGNEAVEIFKTRKLDLLLMDIQMPDKDGITATQEIRAYEKISGGHIPIIALTAGVLESEKEKCKEVGMDGFLTKPIDLESMKVVFAKFLV